jgi:tRNA pseudouridine38-40 synthase
VLHSNLHITPHRSEYDVRLLSCRIANHLVRNNLYRQGCENQPEKIDWNARFTATSRTYCYRILHMTHPASDASTKIICPSASDELEYIFPFESGRSWIIRENTPLNMENMIQASKLLEGKQDFSSFRAKGCQRASPIVHINKIVITSQPVPYPFWYSTPSWMDSNSFSSPISRYNHDMSIITIMIQGESFLYRQVRNMVGCLVEVGQNKLSLEEIKDIIVAKDRRKAPPMAPAHGLYLVDVSHYWE